MFSKHCNIDTFYQLVESIKYLYNVLLIENTNRKIHLIVQAEYFYLKNNNRKKPSSN